jgi:LysR family transcriptional regulator, nitrogen assimilation regulatory protein
MIELRPLAYFAAACRSESFAHAAADLDIALSTLSTTMKTLEQDLGTRLFHRVNNSLYPTAAGRALLRAADAVLQAERFARHWTASARTRLGLVAVTIGLSFTIGGMGRAVRRAVEGMMNERPDILVDAAWDGEKNVPWFGALAGDASRAEPDRVAITLGRSSDRATPLLLDRWVFACRLPARTQKRPTPEELRAGRLIVPRLAPPLIEQADSYFTQNGISRVRFLTDHPGDLPRLIDEYPDAAVFVPESLIAPRLGLLNVVAIPPTRPLTMEIAAHEITPSAATALFIRHLKRALASDDAVCVERPLISLRQLRYLGMVHRLRRVSAAARGANISQPALSEQLRKLEASLACQLYERNGDGLIPTAKGERFAMVAKVIEAAADRLLASIDQAAPMQGRTIAVGILPSVNQHGFLLNRITETLLEIQARHPGLKMTVREAPNGTLQDWVMRGLVGVAIVETALPHMPRLPLGSSEALAAVAHKRHRLLPPGPVTLARLLQKPLALPTSRFGLRRLLESAAEQHGLRLHPDMEIDALSMAVAMLHHLPVCTVLPASAVQREVASGELMAHTIVEPAVSRQLFVIYSGERTLSEPERNLVNSLRRKLAEQSAGDLPKSSA